MIKFAIQSVRMTLEEDVLTYGCICVPLDPRDVKHPEYSFEYTLLRYS